MPTPPVDPALADRLERLRRRVDEQGEQARVLRRRHRERAAASAERRSEVLDRIIERRREAGLGRKTGPD